MEVYNDMSQTPLLEVRNLTKVFHSRGRSIIAVDNLSFAMSSGKAATLALVGESGSGKTTTGLMILGLLKPTSGEILYKGKDIQKMTKDERIEYRRKIQAIFQDPYEVFNPFYKVDRMLQIPIRKFKLASSKEEERKIIVDALQRVKLVPEEVLGKYPHQLSGGQRQRIMVARALLTHPEIIIADEPVSMVDASLRASILNTMLDLKKEYNISYIFITHDLSLADYFSDNIIALYRGSCVEGGETKVVLKKPAHPYLKLLIDSVPVPDPERRWSKATSKDAVFVEREETVEGCKFYSRCPYAMDVCAKKRPETVMLGENRFVACHLYSK